MAKLPDKIPNNEYKLRKMNKYQKSKIFGTLTSFGRSKKAMSQKTILIIGIIGVIALVSIILFSVQKAQKEGTTQIGNIEELAQQALIEKNIRELMTETKTEKPYFETHPEELNVTELKIDNFMFTKGDDQGIPIPNFEKEFKQGQQITFSFTASNYMEPKVKENKYVYGIIVEVETTDLDGNNIKSLTQKMVDIANYHETKGIVLQFNQQILPDNTVKPGQYKLKIKVTDKISEKVQTIEEEFKII